MSSKSIRLIVLLLAMLFVASLSFASTERKINFSDSGNEVQLLNNNDFGFDLQFKLQDFSLEEVNTRSGIFDQISIEGFGYSGRIGEPKLPVYSKLISVPLGAEVQFELVNRNNLVINKADNKLKNRLIPAQESVSKSDNPELIPFQLKADAYARNEFVGGNLFSVEEIGIMRGVRVFRLDYEPVSYNPISGDLQVVSNAYIQVKFINPDMAATEALMARTGSFEYDQLYAKTFYNWRTDERLNVNRYPTKMLILCPPNYTDELQPFVDWKKQQGFGVTVTTVGTGGTVANTTAAIISYMQGVWSAATAENPAPTYLLIVGDTSTSGDNIIANTGASGSHPTDLTYVRLSGTDYLPEMYYGRFSVASGTELTNVITKTLTFEKTLMPDLSYLGKVVMIAGVDASYAPTYGNGQINYGTTHYFNSTNGLTSNTYLYPESGSSDASIIANANEGRGYMNYTAHGSETSWADPTFTVSDVNAMTNTNKYGVMVGNCCVTNAFATSVCFGESIIRKANAGGVVYIGATNNSYWDEDYWWGIGYKTPIQAAAHAYNSSSLGAYDALFHTHSEAQTNWATTVGEMNVMGNSAVEQSTSTRKPYYWEIYSIMGDPSLMPYMGVPTVNTATFPTTILIGVTSITVTATPYSRVALTMGGVTYGTGIVPAGGSLTLAITPFSSVGTASLVITAQNKITRIESITIAPNSGAYMTVDANTYNDTNNSIAEYNETGRYTTTFKNVGSVASGTVTATLTCATAGITITDGTESVAALAAGASVVKTNAFSFTVANNIVNQLSASFTITMVSGASTWVHNFSQVFNAPAMAFGAITISDPAPGNNNGRIDPGETVTITMPLVNSGAATSPAGSATLSSPTSGITINTGTANFAAIAAGGSANLSFSLTAGAGMTIGTVAVLNFSATAGAYTAAKVENSTIGIIMEDFEAGNFNSYPWVMGTTPWTVVNTGAYAGTYAAKSGAITHSQTSTLETTRVLSTGGTLTFWYKVSSEASYDYLKFYVDGVVQNSPGWAGEIGWTQATYTLAAGTRVLKWEYMKDGSVDSGSNCAWVDNIVFPASTAPSSFYPPQNLVAAAGNAVVNLTWNAPVSGTPTGYKIFKNSTLLTTVTGLSYSDNAVSNGTTYSYYLKAVYSGGESDATATVNATPSNVVVTEVIIGSGTSTTATSAASPINVYYKSLHGQSVYTRAELVTAGMVGPVNITQLGFNITGLPTVAMPNFVVRMKHTTATDVTNWIDNTGLTTVYSNASYLPTATGYNMYTLSTPFLWNGTDNILIDTAFGVFTPTYTQTGTVQYTTVTNGYRYGRSDTIDQTNLFTGGSVAATRPNVKLIFAPVTANPQIAVNPTSLSFGAVAVGASATQNITISNVGGGTLTGSITTPAGYTAAVATREGRNTLNFSITTTPVTYAITFAPTAATSYNENIVINTNSETQSNLNLAVTGSGYIPPTISVDAQQLTASLAENEDYNDSFTISNTGSQPLNYTIGIAEVRSRGRVVPLTLSQTKDGRSIAGSTLTVDVAEYTPGATENWTFTVTNASTDTEWLEHVYITFPAGITVNSATNFVGGTGGDLVPDQSSGSGITIDWFGEDSSGWGVIQGSQSAVATVNVTVAPGLSAPLDLAYQINGDVYGAEPHVLNDVITLPAGIPPVEWFSASPLSGTIDAGAHATITGYFSSTGMDDGLYEALLSINSNDPVNPIETVQILMEVAVGNHTPHINLPTDFSFDKNGSLVESFASYISDADADPLTLTVSGNTNVLVDIVGSSVTFTATQNWFGSEVLTFTVSDGTLMAQDNVTITVNPTDTPDWEPVVYPNNPATIYAMVTIDGIPAQLNDMVAAFVGNECRGTGQIVVIDRVAAYATLVVNLASSGETVSFKIYSYGNDTIYPVTETMPMVTGATYGDTVPVPLNGTLDMVVAAPSVNIQATLTGARIAWGSVQNANNYKVYSCDTPYGTYTFVSNTANTYFDVAGSAAMKFYKIVAEHTTPSKGN